MFWGMLAQKAGGKRMAHQEQLATLLRGVATCNDWNKHHPAIGLSPTLSDANLGKATLHGAWAGHSFVVCTEPDRRVPLLTIRHSYAITVIGAGQSAP